MFDINPEEEHAKHFSTFQAKLRPYLTQIVENHKGEKKRFDQYFSYEEVDGKKHIHLTEDAPKEVERTLQVLIRDYLTPPFHP